jgi:hypothetical protein
MSERLAAEARLHPIDAFTRRRRAQADERRCKAATGQAVKEYTHPIGMPRRWNAGGRRTRIPIHHATMWRVPARPATRVAARHVRHIAGGLAHESRAFGMRRVAVVFGQRFVARGQNGTIQAMVETISSTARCQGRQRSFQGGSGLPEKQRVFPVYERLRVPIITMAGLRGPIVILLMPVR